MSLIKKILGRPLATSASKEQRLSVLTGVPALGLDAFASIAYGPEAALMVLSPLGFSSGHYFFMIILGVIFVFVLLAFSYFQTITAYPNGGGAYIVASDNLGKRSGSWAAVALLLDYLLNVTVGISAGIAAIVSAIPALHEYTLLLCLIVLGMLTVINLRGVKESGIAFAIPTILFVLCLSLVIFVGFIQFWHIDEHAKNIISPSSAGSIVNGTGIWLLLGAFANGLTAMTGIEAISNAVPIFRAPSVRNAHQTLLIIVSVLGLFLLALAYLCPLYHVTAMDETRPGYQTILNQLLGAIAGHGVFYYIATLAIFVVLTFSAQTSFIGFPRVCRLLAEDSFLPDFFAERGRRLVYSYGIGIVSFLSALLLIIFKGITLKLIPLFAVGAFCAFFFSQLGMALHWLHHREKQWKIKLFLNALGALVTGISLIIIIVSKFIHGAWIIVMLIPLLALLLHQVKHHYKKIARQVDTPIELQTKKLHDPIVVIPIQGWNCVAEKAVRFGLLLSNKVNAVYVRQENDDTALLKKIWKEKVTLPAKKAGFSVPRLKIISSPYRRVYKPILQEVKRLKHAYPSRIIAVVIPELIEPHWYEYVLHNIHATGLRTLLFLERDQRTIVITTPWYLRERKTS